MFAKKKKLKHPFRAGPASKSTAGNGAGKASVKRRALADPPPMLRETLVEKLFGDRCDAAEWVLELCAADPAFLFHLSDQFADGSRGYVHYLCVLHLALPAQFADGGDAPECARLIRTTTKKALLKAWLPSCPAAILTVLPKLPDKPLACEAEYRRLIRALANKKQRKYLTHLERVRPFDVQLLDRVEILPARFGLAAAHCGDVEDYEQLCVFVECAKRLNLKITEPESDAVAKEAESLKCLWRYLARQVAEMPFPPPPWEGNDNMRPLRSRREMEEASERFDNCATHYLFEVVAGRSYLYVCERPQAMVEIVSDVFFGWMVNRIEGPNGKPVLDSDALDIKRAFYGAGICQKTITSDDLECVGYELHMMFNRFSAPVDLDEDDDDFDDEEKADWERDDDRSIDDLAR